jgi:hypothetical protein
MVPFPSSLPSCGDTGTPIESIESTKFTQNLMISSVTYPLVMQCNQDSRLRKLVAVKPNGLEVIRVSNMISVKRVACRT